MEDCITQHELYVTCLTVMDDAPLHVEVYDEETLEALERDFSRLKDECYLDHAGATLYSERQMQIIGDDFRSAIYGNPHSVGIASGMTYDIVERVRMRVLEHFQTTSDEYSVIFTSGATHGIKIIAETFTFRENEDQDQGHFVYTQDNHTSVLGMRELVARRGAKVTCLNHDRAFDTIRSVSIAPNDDPKVRSNSLFVFPAQCNFSGLKYPLRWIADIHAGGLRVDDDDDKVPTNWYVLLDAAAFVPTNSLNLSVVKPDFVTMSFYKMFGYPTGLGVLLVKNSSAKVLNKVYYGGGTVEVSLSSKMFHVKRKELHKRFEDGTVPFLSIAALQHGFDILSKLNIDKISMHVHALARYLHHSLLIMHHANDAPVVRLYSDTDYEDRQLQGGIVTFNILRSNGEYVGYMEVLNMAALFKIHMRSGCFCNPGACQRHLSLTNEDILQNYDAGYVCSGTTDLLDGKPTGAVRISFGYMSTIKNAETVLFMIRKCFLDGPEITKLPDWWNDNKEALRNKYNAIKVTHKVPPQANTNGSEIVNPRDEIETAVYCEKFKETQQSSLPKKNKLKLARLFIYPIKSCAAYEVTDSWKLNSRGLEYDREWMVMTAAGVCLTQKQQVNLCLIKPTICKKTNVMKLTYPGMPGIEVPLNCTSNNHARGTMCQSRVCGHKVQGTDCGGEISEWLSLALGRPNLRLIRQDNQHDSEHDRDAQTSELSFSSQAQYLLLNESSILWLTDRISENVDFERSTVLHRFRGNLILTGCNAFEEVNWKKVRIGDNEFTVNGPCNRCQMICIDQTTGEKTVEPLRTLAKEFHGKLKFGIYLTRRTKKNGILSITDSVQCT